MLDANPREGCHRVTRLLTAKDGHHDTHQTQHGRGWEGAGGVDKRQSNGLGELHKVRGEEIAHVDNLRGGVGVVHEGALAVHAHPARVAAVDARHERGGGVLLLLVAQPSAVHARVHAAGEALDLEHGLRGGRLTSRWGG